MDENMKDAIEALAHCREMVDELYLCSRRLQKDRDLLQEEVHRLREKIKWRICDHPSISGGNVKLCNDCKETVEFKVYGKRKKGRK